MACISWWMYARVLEEVGAAGDPVVLSAMEEAS